MKEWERYVCSSRDGPPWYIKGTGQCVEKLSSCNPVFDKAWLCVWAERSGSLHKKQCSLALPGKKTQGDGKDGLSFLLLHAPMLFEFFFFNLNLTLFCVFFLTYFVLGCRWLRMLWQFSVDNEGTQPYKYVYPFSPKSPSTFIINFDKHSPEESSIVMQTLRNSSFVQSCLSGFDVGKLTGFMQWWKPWVWQVGNGVKGWPTRGNDIIGFIYL